MVLSMIWYSAIFDTQVKPWHRCFPLQDNFLGSSNKSCWQETRIDGIRFDLIRINKSGDWKHSTDMNCRVVISRSLRVKSSRKTEQEATDELRGWSFVNFNSSLKKANKVCDHSQKNIPWKLIPLSTYIGLLTNF